MSVRAELRMWHCVLSLCAWVKRNRHTHTHKLYMYTHTHIHLSTYLIGLHWNCKDLPFLLPYPARSIPTLLWRVLCQAGPKLVIFFQGTILVVVQWLGTATWQEATKHDDWMIRYERWGDDPKFPKFHSPLVLELPGKAKDGKGNNFQVMTVLGSFSP